MDVVAFKGIKNIGVLTLENSQGLLMHRMVMRLTNDGNPDLSDFKIFLSSCPPKKPDLLQVDMFVGGQDKRWVPNDIFVNGEAISSKPENNSFLARCAALFDSIPLKTDEELAVPPEYIYGGKFREDTINYIEGEKEILDSTPNEAFHDPDVIIDRAAVISNGIRQNLNSLTILN